MEKIFSEKAMKLLHAFEGGKSDHKNDKGGRTNQGIIQSVYDDYRLAKGLTKKDVYEISGDEVLDIYYSRYWLVGKCDKLPEKIAIAQFDSCVNHGPGNAAKFLQRALGVDADGKIGPITLEKVKSFSEIDLIEKYSVQRETFYRKIVERDPSQNVFLKGWLRRNRDLTAYLKGEKSLEQIKKEW